jgi:hypothetical protein
MGEVVLFRRKPDGPDDLDVVKAELEEIKRQPAVWGALQGYRRAKRTAEMNEARDMVFRAIHRLRDLEGTNAAVDYVEATLEQLVPGGCGNE